MPRRTNDEQGAKGSRITQILLALIAAISTILVGYWQFSRQEVKNKAHFAGRVSDATGNRVEGAKVTLEAQVVSSVLYTDSEGNFIFPLPDGASYVRITVEAPGYKRYERRIDPGAISEPQDIRLSKSFPVPVIPDPGPPPITPPKKKPLPVWKPWKSESCSCQAREASRVEFTKLESPDDTIRLAISYCRRYYRCLLEVTDVVPRGDHYWAEFYCCPE